MHIVPLSEPEPIKSTCFLKKYLCQVSCGHHAFQANQLQQRDVGQFFWKLKPFQVCSFWCGRNIVGDMRLSSWKLPGHNTTWFATVWLPCLDLISSNSVGLCSMSLNFVPQPDGNWSNSCGSKWPKKCQQLAMNKYQIMCSARAIEGEVERKTGKTFCPQDPEH